MLWDRKWDLRVGSFQKQSAEKPFPPELKFGLMGDPATFLRINEACSCLVRKHQRNSEWKSRGEIAPAFSTEARPRQQARVLPLLSVPFFVLPGAGGAHYRGTAQWIKE